MASKSITFDTRAWTGPELPDWPSPDAFPYPEPLQARPSLTKSVVMAVFCLLAAGLALKSLIAATPATASGLLGSLAAFVTAAFFAALVFWRARQAMQSNEPAVELSARGLAYPAFLGKTVPWSEIADVEYVSPLAAGWRSRFPGVRIKIRGLDRFEPKRKTVLGLDMSAVPLEYMPLPGMLDVWPRQLYRSLQAHRAHFGRGGGLPSSPAP